MRLRESASWDLDTSTRGGRGEGVGTVLVGEGVREVLVPVVFVSPRCNKGLWSIDNSGPSSFVFNSGIPTQENPFEIITRVVQDKKLATSNASLMLEDFDPPLYELSFFKEVPRSKMLLPFSSKHKEKVFKPRIHTSERVHSSLIIELSHQ
nr:hypothetical protein [Tanacetum cinerariifolium]